MAPDCAMLARSVFSSHEHLRNEGIGSTMAHDDDEFLPRFGRIRSRGSSKHAKPYLQRVLRAIALAGGRPRGGRPTGGVDFMENRIGRGAGVGRVLVSRDRYAAFRARRVVVKTGIVKMAGRRFRRKRGESFNA
jgi:hypothetical protein